VRTARRVALVTAFTLLVLALPMLLAQPAQAEDTRLFVDAAATQNGDGSRHRPFGRITDAVVAARALRHNGAGPVSFPSHSILEKGGRHDDSI